MFKMPDQLENVLLSVESEADQVLLASAAIGDPLKYYCPHIGQERYIKTVDDAVKSSSVSTVLITSANGWGKTTTSIHILLNIIYGVQNGWFDYDVYKAFPFPKLCWYVTSSSALKNVILPEIQRLGKKGSYKCFNQGKPTVSMIEFDNGWRINFFTTDQGVEQFESATVGLIICDEPVDEPIYKALKSRKRGGNLMLMPMTPLDCDPFIIDEVVAQSGNGRYYHITGSVYEASKTYGVGEHCGVRGHLDASVIDDMVADYDMDEREARVYGRFMYFSERIWANFKETRTVVDPETFPVDVNKDYIIQVVDPHDGRESAAIYIAYKENGRIVVFNETPADKSRPYWEMKRTIRIEDEVRNWFATEDDFGIRELGQRVFDKRFAWQKRGGTNLATLFSDAAKNMGRRFNLVPSYKNESQEGEIAYGHKIVRSYLEPMEDGYSRLVIWNSCFHLINGMKHYVRKRPKTTTELNKPADENKIIERYKDFNDCLRYGLVALHNYTRVIENRKKKRPIRIKYTADPLAAVL